MEKSPKMGEVQPERIPPMRTSGASLKKYQGGVDVPKGERWALRLTSEFSDLNIRIQDRIIEIIGNIRKENPEKAVEIAHRIGDFFSHTGDYAKDMNVGIQEFLEQLEDGLVKERNKKIN